MAVALYASKDEQLFAEVQKLIDGNYDSYEMVYELSQKYIYKIINDIVKNHHTTEDMMQETYIQIYNKIGTLREARTFYVWAGRIASNLTLRHLQKYRKELLTDGPDEDGEDFIFDKAENDHEEFIPESVLENKEQQRIIADILDGLSPEQKLCVQYYYYEEMSVGDIANLMGCSDGTIKSRLNYARKALKDAVSKFEVKNGVKLYSISGLPIYYIVFKAISESAVLLGTGGAVAAGSIVAEGLVAAGKGAGTGAAAGSAGAIGGAGSAGATGTVGGVGAVGTAGAVGTVGVAGATTTAAGTGFIGTLVGKVAVVAVTVSVGAGGAVASTEAAKDDMVAERGRVITAEEVLSDSYWNTNEADAVDEFLGASAYDYSNLDQEYLEVVNELAAQYVLFEKALKSALTPSQQVVLNDYMEAYVAEIEGYLQDGEMFSQMIDEDVAVFVDYYYDDLLDILRDEADVIGELATLYSKSEIKTALSGYSVEQMQVAFSNGYALGDMVLFRPGEWVTWSVLELQTQVANGYDTTQLLNSSISDATYQMLMNTTNDLLTVQSKYLTWIQNVLNDSRL